MPRSDSLASRSSSSPRGKKPFSAGSLLLMLFVVAAYAVAQWLVPADKPRSPSKDGRPSAEAPDSRSEPRADDVPASDKDASREVATRTPDDADDSAPATRASTKAAAPKTAPPGNATFVIRDVTILDQDGDVAYRGDVDLTKTLARIDRGQKLSFPHDGTVFGNRERRLPAKPSGYYREWVHPTPKLSGPGPQRIVTGGQGEAYYTHDHYRSFRKVR